MLKNSISPQVAQKDARRCAKGRLRRTYAYAAASAQALERGRWAYFSNLLDGNAERATDGSLELVHPNRFSQDGSRACRLSLHGNTRVGGG